MDKYQTEHKLAEAYAAKRGYDRVDFYITWGGKPTFVYCNESDGDGHKLGYPHMVMVDGDKALPLDRNATLDVIAYAASLDDE